MKILWFANTPCNAAKILDPNLVIGGWLNALEDELVQNDEIELNICFYWTEIIKPFKDGKVNYYPINIPKRKRALKRFISNYDEENEVKKLIEVVKIIKPDLIHIHGTEYNFGLIQKYVDTTSVVSLQGILGPYLEKYFSGIPKTATLYNEEIISKINLTSEIINYQRLKKSSIREQIILKNSSNIIGRTDWDRRIAKILSPKAKYYFGNEILRNSFYENIWKKESFGDNIRIVTIMSGGLYKGLETIAKTLLILKSNNLRNFTWYIIGQTENDSLSKIVKSWLNLSFDNINLKFMGKLKEKELIKALLDSDIYCQVSHIENSPNSVCEAMLLGMPIIASFAGGTDSILENKKEGILVQDGDSYSLAGTLLELSDNVDLARNFGYKARERALNRHDPKKIGNEYIEIYKNLLT